MTTSFQLNTFWFHVKWNSDGTVGKDQHKQLWYHMINPISQGGEKMSHAANPNYKAEAEQVQKALSNKEYFMQQRAEYAEGLEEIRERRRVIEMGYYKKGA